MAKIFTTFEAKLDAQSKVVFTEEGYMIVPATLTRTGVFDYPERNRKELRPPDEVFDKASMDSMAGKSVTLFHPSEMVNPKNVRDLEIGQVIGPAQKSGDFLTAPMIIKDKDTIDFLQNARVRKEDVKVSCGYWSEDDPTPGDFNGEKYDVIQRRIRYNHVAIGVNNPRAGGSARLALDNKNNKGGSKMKLNLKAVKFDGYIDLPAVSIETEKADEITAALTARTDALDAAIVKMQATIGEQKAKLDAAQAKLDAGAEKEKALEKTIGELKDINGAHVKAMVATRKSLDETAEAAGVKIDNLDVKAAQVAIIEKTFDGKKMDGKSDDYIAAMYDSAVETINARKNADNLRRTGGEPNKSPEPEKTRQEQYDEIHNGKKK